LNEKGERLIWLEVAVLDRLTALRGPSESYSEVTLRLVEIARRSTERRIAPRVRHERHV